MEDLRIEIGGRAVVDGVSFVVPDGARVGIIGESGSGKSLTALALLGLLPDAATATGSIRWDGREILGLPDRELARLRGDDIGIVFQEPRTALNPIRTVGRQIGESIRIHEGVSRREALRRAVAEADRVALPDPARIVSRYPHQLSGGQLQRAALAGVLVLEPRVLIADEPTTGLDATTQKKIVALVKALQREMNMSVIWTSHDLVLVGEIADEIVVAYAGQPVEIGTVEEVLKRPAHPYTLGLLESRPQATMAPKSPLRSVGGTVPDPGDWPPACRFAPRCRRALAICGTTPPPMELFDEGSGRRLRCYNPEPGAAEAGA